MMHKRLGVGEAGLGRKFNLFRQSEVVRVRCWGRQVTALHFRIYGLGKLRDNCLCS